MSADKLPTTLVEAVRYFTPERADQFIRAIKWKGHGPACPRCGSTDVGEIKTRRRFQCREWLCRRQFSLTTGTILEGTHLTADKWVIAIWMLVTCRNGVSSHEMSRTLGIKQQSAWHLLHRVRHILKADNAGMLGGGGGAVEADCTFVGGQLKFVSAHRRRRRAWVNGHLNKTVVQGLKDRTTGQVRATVVDAEGRTTVEPDIRANVLPGSRIYTDASKAYRWITYAPEYTHGYVNHIITYVEGQVHTNGLENFFNCLRRGLKGTYVRATPEHLAAYVDEQVYRFNNRKQTDWERFEAAMHKIIGKRLTYSQLTAGATR